MSDYPRLAVRGLHKRFGGVHALRGIDVDFLPGRVHCVVGENGAGKSTLGKIIAGVHQPDSGVILIGDQQVTFHSAREALNHSIALIAQEIAVVPARSVSENLMLGREPHRFGIVSRRTERGLVDELQQSYDSEIDPSRPLRSLRQAEQQKVEILRAVGRDSQVIIMDEPTAALSADEAGRLLGMIAALRAAMKTVILISHHLNEVMTVADEITILRNGDLVRTRTRTMETPEALVEGMLGRPLEQTFPPKAAPTREGSPVLEVHEVAAPPLVTPTTFNIYPGEILGIVGLVGSGRSELARAIYGADRRPSGRVVIGGQVVRKRTPRRCVRAGLALLPESRKEQGLLMASSVLFNTNLAAIADFSRRGILRPAAERAAAFQALQVADTRYASLDSPVSQLSGGNQQKVLFGRWLLVSPRVLIVDEPTRGVDVGAKVRIHGLLADLAAQGMGILLISSESDEVFGLAHRVLAMRNGNVVGEFDGPNFPRDEIMNRVLR